MSRTHRIRRVRALLATALVGVTAVPAFPWTPPATAQVIGSADGTATVSVCVDAVTGEVRVTATPECDVRSVAVTWNIPGVAGPPTATARTGGFEGSGLVMACVDRAGTVRIVTDNTTIDVDTTVGACTEAETPRSWRVAGPQGPAGDDPPGVAPVDVDGRFPVSQAVACAAADGSLRLVRWDVPADDGSACDGARTIRWFLNGPPGARGERPRQPTGGRVPVPVRRVTTTTAAVTVTVPIGPVTSVAPRRTTTTTTLPKPAETVPVTVTPTTVGGAFTTRPVPRLPFSDDGPSVPDGVVPSVCYVGAIGQRAVAGRFGYVWVPPATTGTGSSTVPSTTPVTIDPRVVQELITDGVGTSGSFRRATATTVATTVATATTSAPTTTAPPGPDLAGSFAGANVPANRNNRIVDDLGTPLQAPFVSFALSGRVVWSMPVPLLTRSYEWQTGRQSVPMSRTAVVTEQNTCPRDGFEGLVRFRRGLHAPTALIQTQPAPGQPGNDPVLGGTAPMAGASTPSESLRRGQAATMIVIPRNVSATSHTGRTLIAGVLPDGVSELQVGSVIQPPPPVSPAATARLRALNPSAFDAAAGLAAQADAALGMTPFWSCTVRGVAFACLGADRATAAGAELPPLYAQFTVDSASRAVFDADVAVAGNSRTFAATPQAAADPVALASGIAGLPGYARTSVDVTGWVADAGEDQTVDARIVKPDGSEVASKVILDGSGTTASGRPQTFRWRQVAGPLADWSPEIVTDNGDAVGKQVVVVAPDVRSAGALTFELTVNDGAEIHRDTVVIRLRPLNHPPRITRFDSDLADPAATPAAGTRVVLDTTVEDPEPGDTVTVGWRVLGPQGPFASALTVDSSTDRRAVLTWPAGADEVTVEITATDQAGAKQVKTFPLGVAAPPLRVSISDLKAQYVTEYQVLALLAVANRPLATHRWRVKSGPSVTFMPSPSCTSTVREECDAIIIRPGRSAQPGDVIVLEVTATDGPDRATAEISVPFSPIPPPRIERTAWIDDPALTTAAAASTRTDLVEIETVEGRRPYTYRFTQRMGPPATIGTVREGPAPTTPTGSPRGTGPSGPTTTTTPSRATTSTAPSGAGPTTTGPTTTGATTSVAARTTTATTATTRPLVTSTSTSTSTSTTTAASSTSITRPSTTSTSVSTSTTRPAAGGSSTSTTRGPGRISIPALTSTANLRSPGELQELNERLDDLRGKTPAEIAATINSRCAAAEQAARTAPPPTFPPRRPIPPGAPPQPQDKGFSVDGREYERVAGPALRAIQADALCRLEFRRAVDLLNEQQPVPELLDAVPNDAASSLLRGQTEVLAPLLATLRDPNARKTCGMFKAYLEIGIGISRQLQFLGADEDNFGELAQVGLGGDAWTTCYREELELCRAGNGDPNSLFSAALGLERQRQLLGASSDDAVGLMGSAELMDVRTGINDCRAARGLPPNPYLLNGSERPGGRTTRELLVTFCASSGREAAEERRNRIAAAPTTTSPGIAQRPRPTSGFDVDLDAVEDEIIGDARERLVTEQLCLLQLSASRQGELLGVKDVTTIDVEQEIKDVRARFDREVSTPLRRAADTSCGASMLAARLNTAPGAPDNVLLTSINLRVCLDEEYALCRAGSDPVFMARAALRVERFERDRAGSSAAGSGITPLGTYGITRFHECRRKRNLPFQDPVAAVNADIRPTATTGTGSGTSGTSTTRPGPAFAAAEWAPGRGLDAVAVGALSATAPLNQPAPPAQPGASASTQGTGPLAGLTTATPTQLAVAVQAAEPIDVSPDPRWDVLRAIELALRAPIELPDAWADTDLGLQPLPTIRPPSGATGTSSGTSTRQLTPAIPATPPAERDAGQRARANGEVVHVPITYSNITTLLSVEVTVTDADGRTVADRVVKTPLTQILNQGGLGCDPGAVFNTVFELLRDGRPVIVTLPIGTLDLGSLQLSSDRPTSNGVCNNNAVFRMVGGSFSLFQDRLTGSNLGLEIRRERVCITSGQVSLPAELRVPPAQVPADQPLCISLRGDPPAPRPPSNPLTCTPGNEWINGRLDWPSTFPFLTLPAGFTPGTFQVSLSCARATFSASARVGTATAPGATAAGTTISVAGTIGFDGAVAAQLSVSDLAVLGGTAALSGAITVPSSGPARFDVRGAVTNPSLGVNGLALTRLEVRAGNDGPGGALTFSLDGAGTFSNGSLPFTLAGAYRGPDDWRLTAATGGSGSWQPLAGLNVSDAQISGSIERRPASGSTAAATAADLRIDVAGAWSPTPGITLRRIGLRASNGPVDAGCPTGLAAGTIWLSLSGAATIRPPGAEPLDLDGGVCAAPGAQAFTITTSTTDAWTPVAGGDLRVDRVAFRLERSAAGDVEYNALGVVQYRGVRLGARLLGQEKRATPADSWVVLDGWAAPAATGGPGQGTPDTAALGLPFTGVHVIYASKAVADYENPADPGFRTPLKAGLSVMGSIALPRELGPMLTKMGASTPAASSPGGRLIVSANFVNGTARVRADLRASDPAAGIVIFETCPNGPPCNDPNTTTGLDARSAFLEMSFGGGSTAFAIGAEAVLRLPASGRVAPNEPPAQPSRLDVTLKASFDLTRQSISVALFTTGNWNDALGVRGLVLSNLVIQGGVNFSGPPLPSIGMGATVVSLPADVRQKLGIANNEPMRFVFNISTTSPVLEITLGVKDGQTFLKPLALISAQRADDVLVDYASLVIAPAGGEVGPYVYAPGISLGFAATIGGTPIDVAATLDLSAGTLRANLDVGAFRAGPVEMSQTSLKLDVSPTAVRFEFDGGFVVTGTTSRFSASVDLAASATGSFSLALSAQGSNIPIGLTGIAIDNIDLAADINIAQLGAPIQAFSFRADFQLNVLGARPRVAASMSLDNGVLRQLQALVTVPPLIVAGTGITGAGCDGVRGQGGDGVCVRLDYDVTRTASPFEFVLTGALSVAGVGAELTMSYDQNGFALAGTLGLAPIATVSVTGRFYRSTSTITVTSPSGQQLRPGDGDFSLTGTAQVNLAGAAASQLTFTAAKVGSVGFVRATGSVTSPVFSLSVAGSFEAGGPGGVRYSLTGNGQVRLVGFSIDANVAIDQAGISVDGTTTLPLNIGTAQLSGMLVYPTPTSPLRFRLTGSGRINDPISGYPAITGSFRLANMAADRTPTQPEFAFDAAMNLPIGNARAALSGRLYQNRSNQPAVFLQGSAGLTLPVIGDTSALVGFGINNDDGRNGVWVSVVALDIKVDGRLDRNGFSVGVTLPATGGERTRSGSIGPSLLTGGLVIGGRVTYSFTGRLSGPTPLQMSFNGRASASAYAYWPPPPGETATYNELTLAASASYPPLSACFTLIAEVCV